MCDEPKQFEDSELESNNLNKFLGIMNSSFMLSNPPLLELENNMAISQQVINKSLMSVGRFTIKNDLSFNPNGDLIQLQRSLLPRTSITKLAGGELGNFFGGGLLDKSIFISQKVTNDNENKQELSNDLFALLGQMANSQEIDQMKKSNLSQDAKQQILLSFGNNTANNNNNKNNINNNTSNQENDLAQVSKSLQYFLQKDELEGISQYENNSMHGNNQVIETSINLSRNYPPSGGWQLSSFAPHVVAQQQQICLIDNDINMEVQSEPDQERQHLLGEMDEQIEQNKSITNLNQINRQQNTQHLRVFTEQLNKDNNTTQQQQTFNSNNYANYSSNNPLQIQNMHNNIQALNYKALEDNNEENQESGFIIEPFVFHNQNQQDGCNINNSNEIEFNRQYPHSDDEIMTGSQKNKAIKIATNNNNNHSQQHQLHQQQQLQTQINLPNVLIQTKKPSGNHHPPYYRQSRHKNVFKNFGGTLLRFVIYNDYFQSRVIKELNNDMDKKQQFQDWLQNHIKLEKKKDFQVAWTTFLSDSEEIKEFKALLRELSRDFFENFAFIYLINSRKISDLQIHLRSIHTYLASINNPMSLNRFQPVRTNDQLLVFGKGYKESDSDQQYSK